MAALSVVLLVLGGGWSWLKTPFADRVMGSGSTLEGPEPPKCYHFAAEAGRDLGAHDGKSVRVALDEPRGKT